MLCANVSKGTFNRTGLDMLLPASGPTATRDSESYYSSTSGTGVQQGSWPVVMNEQYGQ